MSYSFNTNGRIRRKDYVVQVGLIAIIGTLLILVAEKDQDVQMIIGFASAVLCFFPAVKRIHDINMSGWFYLWFLIPVVNIIFGLFVLFKEGTRGANDYGEDPKTRNKMIKD